MTSEADHPGQATKSILKPKHDLDSMFHSCITRFISYVTDPLTRLLTLVLVFATFIPILFIVSLHFEALYLSFEILNWLNSLLCGSYHFHNRELEAKK